MRLLYVEDDEDLRELAALCLQLAPDLTLSMAGDGEAALDAVADAETPFDALVIDAGLPRIDGAEVVRRLRRNPANDDMAVLFCTGRSDTAFHEELRRLGADAVLVKPVPLTDIPARARECIDRRRGLAA